MEEHLPFLTLINTDAIVSFSSISASTKCRENLYIYLCYNKQTLSTKTKLNMTIFLSLFSLLDFKSNKQYTLYQNMYLITEKVFKTIKEFQVITFYGKND